MKRGRKPHYFKGERLHAYTVRLEKQNIDDLRDYDPHFNLSEFIRKIVQIELLKKEQQHRFVNHHSLEQQNTIDH